MSNPMFNPQPNYSGVTIQISNPAVNVNPYGTTPIPQGVTVKNGNYAACPQACYCDKTNNNYVQDINNSYGTTNPIQTNSDYVEYQQQKYPQQAYPAEYYLNNYSNPQKAGTNEKQNQIGNNRNEFAETSVNKTDNTETINNTKQNTNRTDYTDNYRYNGSENNQSQSNYNNENNTQGFVTGENINIDDSTGNDSSRSRYVDPAAGVSPYKDYAKSIEPKQPEDMTASKTIIGSLDERNAEIKEAKKNTKEQKIVALTDEYIMSLENYLNNPNDEIRLMASKEILTRLDEDKDRYDDAALNALLNKMLQDPSKLIRLAALSAFASQLACGNEYTVQLLQNIQSNPNADKEDALQAADILLKMSAGVEVKNVPASEVKREQYKMKQ
ncbi:hypothetical protein IKQ21_06025 [bacterium]|nr:hypothetical protein [bacterium]